MTRTPIAQVRLSRRGFVGLAGITAGGLAVSLSSCSSSSDSDGEGEAIATLTIMAPYLSAEPPESGDTIQKELEELTGQKISIQWVPNSDYGDKANIVMVSDDQPAVQVASKTANFIKNAQAGAFWDLTDYLDDYPGLQAASDEVQANASIDGRVYGIYRARDEMRTAVMVRQDWLENLGLEMPTSTDELYEVAKAFTEQDPDGNGEDDTYGMIVPSWPGSVNSSSPYDTIATWFGAGNGWAERDGQLVPNYTTDEWLEANEYVKRFVDEGLINPDYATMDSVNWNEPFFNGKGGIIIDVHSRVSALVSLFRESDPDHYQDYVAFTGNLTGPDGQMYAQPTDGYSSFLAISKASVRTEGQLRTVLSFLEKLNTKEAQVLLNNGIEGVNFEVEDGMSVTLPDLSGDAKAVNDAVASYAQIGMAVSGYLGYTAKPATDYDQEVVDERDALMASDLENAVYNPAAPYVSATQTEKGAELDNVISDARIQYYAGQIDLDGLKDAISRWRSSGGDQVISEINEKYEAAQK